MHCMSASGVGTVEPVPVVCSLEFAVAYCAGSQTTKHTSEHLVQQGQEGRSKKLARGERCQRKHYAMLGAGIMYGPPGIGSSSRRRPHSTIVRRFRSTPSSLPTPLEPASRMAVIYQTIVLLLICSREFRRCR
eukprot:3819591-Rhodomonas_salina.1